MTLNFETQSLLARWPLGNAWHLQDWCRLQVFQRQEYGRRQYSLEIYLEPTKRINTIDQRRNRFLVSLNPPIRRRVKLVDKTILRRSLIGH
jgi:hypothetical protein